MEKYKISLSAEQRESLHKLLAPGVASGKKQLHARILLHADDAPGGPAWTDARIADELGVHISTVERIRERFVEQGLDAALSRKPRPQPPRQPSLDHEAVARLLTLVNSAPPPGAARWTLRLLADKLIELQIVATVSTETIRRTLKKTNTSLASSIDDRRI
jgi:transposase